MPRRNNRVKLKHDLTDRSTPSYRFRSIGLIDIHFHGAFGIDLMSASEQILDELSSKLWEEGIAGFCPTTLSVPPLDLAETVGRLGKWIRQEIHPGAKPLGIHLEGPFIHPKACGAHPQSSIRPLDFKELDDLWEKSLKTLKILTIAPETLTTSQLEKLVTWTKGRGIVLSLGHSQASEEMARQAFDAGFKSVTHAWNALPCHHRSPGVMGAALGRDQVYLELIPDQVHVSPIFIRWTLKLHSKRFICFISDCAPAAGLYETNDDLKWYSFGPLKIQFQQDACRMEGGHLAGGGLLLSQSYMRWLIEEAKTTQLSLKTLFRNTIQNVTLNPLKLLGIPPRLFKDRQVKWELGAKIGIIPQT